MNWVIAKDEHNCGSTDPIVARTVIQAGKIVPLYEFSHDKEQAIVHKKQRGSIIEFSGSSAFHVDFSNPQKTSRTHHKSFTLSLEP